MRCDDCVGGEVDPAECCDRTVTEHVEYLEGYVESVSALLDAARGVVWALHDHDRGTLDAAISALVEADYARKACGGVIDGLVEEVGNSDHRAQRRRRPW